jgi:hypothetical protein
VRYWWRGDLGITLNGAGVSGWADQIAGALFANAIPAKQPLYKAADPSFNGRSTVETDGVDDGLVVGSIDMTGPMFIITVCKLIAFTNIAGLYGPPAGNVPTGINYLQLYAGSAYQTQMGGNFNSASFASVLGNWARWLDRRTGSGLDYIKIGADPKAAGSPCFVGGASIQPWAIGGNSDSGSPVYNQVAYREIIVCAGEPTAAELTALDAYLLAQGPMLQ